MKIREEWSLVWFVGNKQSKQQFMMSWNDDNDNDNDNLSTSWYDNDNQQWYDEDDD